MRREGIGCLLKMSLVSVLLENSPGRVSTSRDFFPLFPSSRAGIRKRSYHPNINSWKNGGEEGGRSTRRRWGCAIGRNRSRNTRISFRNLEGVCVCVCARSCSPRKYASSRCFGFVARARIIFDAARVSSRLENTPPEFSSPNWPETIRPNPRGRTVCRLSPRNKETKLISSKLVPSLFSSSFSSSSSITDDFMRCWILKCRILDRVSRAYGGKIDFRLFWETIRGEYRSIDISARDNSWRIGSVGSIDVLVEI